MSNLIIDTPSRHVYTGDGSTRVFPIPTFIEGDDWIRIEINGVHQIDRRQWDIVNNSIIFVIAPEADATIDVLVASSIEAMTQFGSTSAIDVVAENITNVNLVGQDIEAVKIVSDNIITVTDGFTEINTVAQNIADVNTVADNILNVNKVADIDLDVTKVANIDTDVVKVATIDTDVVKVSAIDTDVVKVSAIDTDVTTVASINSDVTTVANIDTDVTTVANNILDIQNAEENAIIAKEEAWRAEAERLTASSYATEPENVYVKLYTSNNDGTFTITDTVDYSSYHWERKATTIVTVGVIDDTISSPDRTYSSNKIDGIVNNIEGDVLALEGRATTLEGDVLSLDGRVSPLESNVGTLNSNVATLNNTTVKLTGNQTVGDVKTFTLSPIVPTPTTDFQVSTKKYVDDVVEGVVVDVNLLRADKYLASQNVVKMIYNLEGKLSKVRYNNDIDVDYEVLTYNLEGKLSNVAHYVESVLRGNTTLSYENGKLVSAPYIEI